MASPRSLPKTLNMRLQQQQQQQQQPTGVAPRPPPGLPPHSQRLSREHGREGERVRRRRDARGLGVDTRPGRRRGWRSDSGAWECYRCS